MNKNQNTLNNDSGQAMVEAAIVWPTMIFLVMMILQLTMVQHARLMTEYAAFCAARTGIVMNGDKDAMERAAIIALSPTFGASMSFSKFSTNLAKFIATQAVTNAIGFPLVRVDTLENFDATANQETHLNRREIDFDDVRPSMNSKTLLQIRVTYMYGMRIPFANAMLQRLYFTSDSAAARLTWRETNTNTLGTTSTINNASKAAFLARDLQSIGLNAAARAKIIAFSALPQTAQGPARNVIPLTATYSMRMQSNYMK